MSLTDAQRGLEVVDAHLTAIQRKLKGGADPDEIIDHLDLVIGDLRAATVEIVEHECLKSKSG